MSISLATLMQETRETVGLQNSQFINDQDELPRIVNQAASNVYDTIVKAYAPYFAARADFSIDSTGIKSLVDIVNPVQPTATYVNGNGTIATGTTNVPITPVFSPSIPPVFYTINELSITPHSPAATAGNTTIQILVNGVATGDSVTVPNGSSSNVVNVAVNPTFNSTDSVTLQAIAGSGASWDVTIVILTTPTLNNPPFYKELGVDFNSQGRPISVPRLDSFLQRNQNNSALSSVEGNYTLWYTPSCPVLDAVTDLPSEMDRFRTMILLEGSVMIMLKRREDISAFETRLAIKTRETVASLRNRSNEPKAIPLRGRSGGCGRSFDIVGPNVHILRSSGYTGDYFWGAR